MLLCLSALASEQTQIASSTPNYQAGEKGNLVTPNATQLTTNLYANLKAYASKTILYGQHHAYQLGEHADRQGKVSDCKAITGDNPAVIGYDLLQTASWDPINTDTDFHRQIVAHFKRGGINTISWHAPNPSPIHTGNGKYNDTTGNPVQGILTNGSQTQANYNAMLDEVCAFLKNLQVDGQRTPILWRPLHEQHHSAFWWGLKHCSAQEFKDLWIYTFNYMVHLKGCDHLIWAVSPNKQTTKPGYLSRYPGDAYVDIIGVDFYTDFDLPANVEQLRSALQVATKLAQARGKLAALTESGEAKGFENARKPDFFTRVWLNNFTHDRNTNSLSYVLTWNSPQFSAFKNGANSHLYNDFMRFFESNDTWFESDLPDLYAPAPSAKPQKEK
jgi:mannan endo-1,4-beta-mannosidase